MVEASSLGELRVMGDPADPNAGQGQTLGALLGWGPGGSSGPPGGGGRDGFLGRKAGVSDQPQVSHWSIVKAWTSYLPHPGLRVRARKTGMEI